MSFPANALITNSERGPGDTVIEALIFRNVKHVGLDYNV